MSAFDTVGNGGHEVGDVRCGIDGQAGIVALDAGPFHADAVGATLRIPHSVDGLCNLVQAVDEVAYATVGILAMY